jgi:oxepin-CoA hydrolase/3-oxo-5,6-dehydrosuberyl-CoA semialdehyde dehydrogenase
MEKINFIKTGFVNLVSQLHSTDIGKWGLMNAQQMVEHVADFFKVSSRKIVFPLVTPAEHLPKYKEFLLSDKEFKENTKAPVLPAEPFAIRSENMKAAIAELQNEITDFFNFFEADNTIKTMHPAFGELNFEEWVLLHYKHTLHHAKQFNLI